MIDLFTSTLIPVHRLYMVLFALPFVGFILCNFGSVARVVAKLALYGLSITLPVAIVMNLCLKWSNGTNMNPFQQC